MATPEGAQPRPRRPPMSSRASSVASFRSRHSVASIRSVSTSGFSFRGHGHGSRSRPHSVVSLTSPAVAAVADASSLPDFAFLSYAALPRGPATLGVRDEASWSYSGPLLNLAEPRDDRDGHDHHHHHHHHHHDARARRGGRILPSSFYEFAENALTSKLPPHMARRPATPGFYSDSEDDLSLRLADAPAASDVLAAALVPFLLFANSFLAANGVHHYWITVRSTRPSHEFDMPRWHTDDFFWDTFRDLRRRSTGGPRDLATDWKLCTTLLGPPTLFVPLPYQSAARSLQRKARAVARKSHPCTSIRCADCTAAAQAVREVLKRELDWMGVVQPHSWSQDDDDGGGGGGSRRHEAAVGQCSFFRIGEDRGAVHSEPRIAQDRIFVNIVPAREDELKKLMGKWGMSYPRDWMVATHRRQFPTSSPI